MNKVSYLMLAVLLLLISCTSSTDTAENAPDDINGKWYITYSNTPGSQVDISANSKSCTFSGIVFTGKWSGNTFNGSLSGQSSGLDYKQILSLTLVDATHISGTIETQSIMNITQQFSGEKIK